MEYVRMSIYSGQYKYVVEFEKAFVQGNLKGLTINDRLHFISKRDAEDWIKDVSKLNRDGQFFNFKVKVAA
jgi:hypothetical protein